MEDSILVVEVDAIVRVQLKVLSLTRCNASEQSAPDYNSMHDLARTNR